MTLEQRINEGGPFLVSPVIALPQVSETIKPESVADRNLANIRELYKLQKRKTKDGEWIEEGCFFVGLYVLSNALYPDRNLPDAHKFWHGIRRFSTKAGVTHPRSKDLLVDESKLNKAFELYESWGIRLTAYRLNKIGYQKIGTSMRSFGPAVPDQNHDNYHPLSTNGTKTPYAMLLHQAGSNNTHFITDDGSKEAGQMIDEFESIRPFPFRKIAIFEFERTSK